MKCNSGRFPRKWSDCGNYCNRKSFRTVYLFSVFDTTVHTFLQADSLCKRRLIIYIYLRVSSLFRKFVTKNSVNWTQFRCPYAKQRACSLHFFTTTIHVWKMNATFFFIKSRFPKRGIKRRSMKVARKVAVAFCVSSLLSSCSALEEILQSSLRIPHHFIKTWLEGGGVRGGPTYTYVVWGLLLWQPH